MPIRILIADDHAVFRSGLKALLEKESDLEVVGETGNGFDTIRAVEQTDLDVLILDITMPGLTGPKVAEAVLKEKPGDLQAMLIKARAHKKESCKIELAYRHRDCEE